MDVASPAAVIEPFPELGAGWKVIKKTRTVEGGAFMVCNASRPRCQRCTTLHNLTCGEFHALEVPVWCVVQVRKTFVDQDERKFKSMKRARESMLCVKARGGEGPSASTSISESPHQPTAGPSGATAATPGALPPGWLRESDSAPASSNAPPAAAGKCGGGRVGLGCLFGPSGQRAASVKQAWRIHSGLPAWHGCDSSDEEAVGDHCAAHPAPAGCAAEARIGGAAAGAACGMAAGRQASHAAAKRLGLPPRWRKEMRSGPKVSYALYFGPSGERAESLKGAWSTHLGEAHPRRPAKSAATTSAAPSAKGTGPPGRPPAGHKAGSCAQDGGEATPAQRSVRQLDDSLAAVAAMAAAAAPGAARVDVAGAGAYVYAYGALPCADNAEALAQAMLALMVPPAAEGVAGAPNKAGTDGCACASTPDAAGTVAGVATAVGVEVVEAGCAAGAEARSGCESGVDDFAGMDAEDSPVVPARGQGAAQLGVAETHAAQGTGGALPATGERPSVSSASEEDAPRDNCIRTRRVRAQAGAAAAAPSLPPDEATGLPAHLAAAAQRASPLLQPQGAAEPPPRRTLHLLLLCRCVLPTTDTQPSLLHHLLHPELAAQAAGTGDGTPGSTGSKERRQSGRKRPLSHKARECDLVGGLPGAGGVANHSSRAVASGGRGGGDQHCAASPTSAPGSASGVPAEVCGAPASAALRSVGAGVDMFRLALVAVQASDGRLTVPPTPGGGPEDSAAFSVVRPVEVPVLAVRVLPVGPLSSTPHDEGYELLNAAADAIHDSLLAGASVLVCAEPSLPMLKQLARADRGGGEAPGCSPGAKPCGAAGTVVRTGAEARGSASGASAPIVAAGRGDGGGGAASCGGSTAFVPPLPAAARKGKPAPPSVQLDAWARASAAAYAVRWRGMPAAEAASAAGVAKVGPARSLVRGYFPAIFSISLFELERSTQFGYYASSTLAFVRGKLARFGGCQFELHLNSSAATHAGMLRALHQAARGRIAFREHAFVPRPKVAPWLLAAMRLATLLEHADGIGGGRTVVTMDVHDDAQLQDAQLRALHGQLWRERKEMCITWWLAEDGAADCLVGAPLPVPRLKACIPDTAYHTNGAGGGLGLHAHMDAGMMVVHGSALRLALRQAHAGMPFKEYLRQYVLHATSIPHGIEEMAWDSYFEAAGWAGLLPLTLFSVHRSLIAGRDTAEPFRDVAKDADGIPTPLPETAPVNGPCRPLLHVREDFDIGRAIFGNSLACCRHSQVLDCVADSELSRAAGGRAVGQRVFVPRGGLAEDDHTGEDIEMCAECGLDEVSPDTDALLLCDGIDAFGAPCPKTYHQACCSPPVMVVPEGEWFCPQCSRARSAEPSGETLE